MPEPKPLQLRRHSKLARDLIESGLIDVIRETMELSYFDQWRRLEGEDLTPSGLHARTKVLSDVIAEFSKLAADNYLYERDHTDTATGA